MLATLSKIWELRRRQLLDNSRITTTTTSSIVTLSRIAITVEQRLREAEEEATIVINSRR